MIQVVVDRRIKELQDKGMKPLAILMPFDSVKLLSDHLSAFPSVAMDLASMKLKGLDVKFALVMHYSGCAVVPDDTQEDALPHIAALKAGAVDE